jgi:hypothetical protein
VYTHAHISFSTSPVAHRGIGSHADCLVILGVSQEYNQLHSPDFSREPGSGDGAQEWHHPAQTCTIPQNVPSVQHVTEAQPPHVKVAFLEFNNLIGMTCASYYYSNFEGSNATGMTYNNYYEKITTVKKANH